MNYYGPRELADGGGWHYTRRNDGNIWPVGYCTGHPGHPSPEEAAACAANYVIDNTTFADHIFDTTHDVPRCKATGCDILVMDGGGAHLGNIGGPHEVVLCLRHRDRDTIATLVGPELGDIMSSW